jgi:hypothetical protein
MSGDIYTAESKNNHIDEMRFIQSMWLITMPYIDITNNIKEACIAAASNGNLDCLKLAKIHSVETFDNDAIVAAENNHLDCLKYLTKLTLNCDICIAAIMNGNIDCLKYMCDNKSMSHLNKD